MQYVQYHWQIQALLWIFGLLMAPRVAKRSTYIPEVLLDARYALVIRRGLLQSERPCPSTFLARRAAWDTHIDLWNNGTIYPVDSIIKKPPPFRILGTCLEFICHGELGLYGYACRLEVGPQRPPIWRELEMQCRHLQEEV